MAIDAGPDVRSKVETKNKSIFLFSKSMTYHEVNTKALAFLWY